jgi:uncharacterized membrane protein SpoIIM required for sporulation
MNKFRIISIIMFIGGLACFCIAGYVYWVYLGLFKTLAYYGLPDSTAYSDPKFATTVFNLKFGIIKYIILGIIGILSGIFFSLKEIQKL